MTKTITEQSWTMWWIVICTALAAYSTDAGINKLTLVDLLENHDMKISHITGNYFFLWNVLRPLSLNFPPAYIRSLGPWFKWALVLGNPNSGENCYTGFQTLTPPSLSPVSTHLDLTPILVTGAAQTTKTNSTKTHFISTIT